MAILEDLEARVVELETKMAQVVNGGKAVKDRVDAVEPAVQENRQRIVTVEEAYMGLVDSFNSFKTNISNRADKLGQWRQQVRRQFGIVTKRLQKMERRLP